MQPLIWWYDHSRSPTPPCWHIHSYILKPNWTLFVSNIIPTNQCNFHTLVQKKKMIDETKIHLTCWALEIAMHTTDEPRHMFWEPVPIWFGELHGGNIWIYKQLFLKCSMNRSDQNLISNPKNRNQYAVWWGWMRKRSLREGKIDGDNPHPSWNGL